MHGEIVPYVNWIICNEEDASDVFGIASESSSIEEGKIDAEGYCGVARRLLERFPKAEYVAITLRESYSANHNNWGAMLYSRAEGKAFFAPNNANGEYHPYEIRNIVDRFGGGDSFGAGLIYALHSEEYRAPATAIPVRGGSKLPQTHDPRGLQLRLTRRGGQLDERQRFGPGHAVTWVVSKVI